MRKIYLLFFGITPFMCNSLKNKGFWENRFKKKHNARKQHKSAEEPLPKGLEPTEILYFLQKSDLFFPEKVFENKDLTALCCFLTKQHNVEEKPGRGDIPKKHNGRHNGAYWEFLA